MTKKELTAEQREEAAKLRGIYYDKKPALKFSQDDVATELGVNSQGAISHYLNGVNPLNLKAAVAFSKVIQEPISRFSQRLERERKKLRLHDDQNVEPGISNAGKVPVISYVQAGTWDEAMNPYDLNDAEKWLSWPTPHSDRSFCLRVKGPSMEPEYMHDGYILVDPSVEAIHGDDIVARTPDGKVTFKKYQNGPEGKHLLAINKDYPNRIMEIPDGTVICGVVTGYWVDKRRKK